MSIKSRIADHLTSADRRDTLAALGVYRADVECLTEDGLDPLGADYHLVKIAAQYGTHTHRIVEHVAAARRLHTSPAWEGSEGRAMEAIARVHLAVGTYPEAYMVCLAVAMLNRPTAIEGA